MLYMGFNAVMGSWKTIAALAPRTRFHSFGVAVSISWPSSRTEPVVRADLGSSPRMARDNMVLPGAGLADDAERLARRQRHGETPDGLQ